MKSTDFLLIILNELLSMGHSNRPSCLSGDHHRHRHHPRQRSTAHTKHLESIILCVCVFVCPRPRPAKHRPRESEVGETTVTRAREGSSSRWGRRERPPSKAKQSFKFRNGISAQQCRRLLRAAGVCFVASVRVCVAVALVRSRSLSVVFDSVCFQSHSNFLTERTCDGGTKTTAGFFPPHLLFYSLLLVCMYIELVHYRYCLLFFINPVLIYTVCGVINSVD